MNTISSNRKTAVHKNNWEPKAWIGKCANPDCKKEFSSKRRDAVFCSQRCRQAYNRSKKRTLAQLRMACVEAQEAARTFANSQDVYDLMVTLSKCVDTSLGQFSPIWVQQTLVLGTAHR